MNRQKLAERAVQQIELAHTYFVDGADHSAARCLRKAAELLEQRGALTSAILAKIEGDAAMTLIRNRATRIYARRMGALQRILISGRCAADEIAALRERTAKPPQITITAKVYDTGSEARKAHHRGKIGR